MHLPIRVMIFSLIFFSQVVFTAVVVAYEEQTDNVIELKDEDIKQELGSRQILRRMI